MSSINVLVYADTSYHLHDIWESSVKLSSKLELRVLIEFPGCKYVAVNSNTPYEYFMKMYKQQVKRL